MFEELSSKLDTVLRRLRGQGKITEANVAETLREVRRVLLDADVNYKVARQFIDDVLKRATGQDVLQSITPGQLIVKIIYDELVSLLGTAKADIASAALPPTVILVAGTSGLRQNDVLRQARAPPHRTGAAPAPGGRRCPPSGGRRSAGHARAPDRTCRSTASRAPMRSRSPSMPSSMPGRTRAIRDH